MHIKAEIPPNASKWQKTHKTSLVGFKENLPAKLVDQSQEIDTDPKASK